MTGKHRFDGVIFDFFGILTWNMVEVIQSFEQREKLAGGTFLRAWADPRGQDLFRRLELGEISQTSWNEGFAALLGTTPENLMARYLHDCFPAYAVLKAARQARQAGIKTAVLSNSLGRDPFDPYAGWDLHSTFDAVVLSADHGVRKPDPEVFHLTLGLLDVEAERCLFVDDSETNLAAAHRLGLTPLLGLDEDVIARRLREVLGLADL